MDLQWAAQVHISLGAFAGSERKTELSRLRVLLGELSLPNPVAKEYSGVGAHSSSTHESVTSREQQTLAQAALACMTRRENRM